MNVAPRDFTAGLYQAFWLPDSQTNFLKAPGQPAPFSLDHKTVSKFQQGKLYTSSVIRFKSVVMLLAMQSKNPRSM